MSAETFRYLVDSYFYYNVIPLSLFEERSFKQMIELLYLDGHLNLPCAIKIKHFPTYDDYFDDETIVYGFHDIGIELEIITYNEDTNNINEEDLKCLLTFAFKKNCGIENEQLINENVSQLGLNNAILKTIDLLDWYCKELSLGNLSTFDNDIRKNVDYFMVLAEHYGVKHLIKAFFITGTPKYPDIDIEQLEKLRWFIANYEQLKKKHPLIIKR